MHFKNNWVTSHNQNWFICKVVISIKFIISVWILMTFCNSYSRRRCSSVMPQAANELMIMTSWSCSWRTASDTQLATSFFLGGLSFLAVVTCSAWAMTWSDQYFLTKDLKDLLRHTLRGWIFLVQPPGITRGTVFISLSCFFVSLVIWALKESRTSNGHFLSIAGSQTRSIHSSVMSSSIYALCWVWAKNFVLFLNTLPMGNNFDWIHPQRGNIESRVTACRVFFSRFLYVSQACSLLVSSVKTNVSLPINQWRFLWTGKPRNLQHMK